MSEHQQLGEQKRQPPPYVDYHAFAVFLDEAKRALPQRVDRKYLAQTSVARSAHRTLLTSLRSLGLIDVDEGRPTLLLPSLLKEGNERTGSLQELVKSVYGDLLGKQHLASLKMKNTKDIAPYFEETYGLKETTAFACASFFVRLARDAKLLPNKRERKERISLQAKTKDKVNLLTVKSELLEKLPDFRNGWRPEDVQAVLQQFERLLSHLEE